MKNFNILSLIFFFFIEFFCNNQKRAFLVFFSFFDNNSFKITKIRALIDIKTHKNSNSLYQKIDLVLF